MEHLLPADLVLQGGGVKGIALAGAVTTLMRRYHFRRIAGTSAGSILASLVAAGYTGDELRVAMDELEYRKVPDSHTSVPLFPEAVSLLTTDGLFLGDYIHEWVREKLAAKGVHTFKDLPALSDPGADRALNGDKAYRLVVTATDITNGRALRLPWDYRPIFGLDPDEQLVGDAVRMSLSIPLFFRPCHIVGKDERRATIVDGGVLNNFPVQLFDRQDGRRPRWPTFGVGVIANLPGADSDLIPHVGRLPGPLGLLSDVLMTAICGTDQTYLSEPRNAARLTRIDTTGVGVVEFGLDEEGRQRLYQNGTKAARAFLRRWNWDSYLERFYSPSS